MKYLPAVLLLFWCAFAIAEEPVTKLTSFDWIVGTWKRETEKAITYESWKKLSDTSFEGESRRISNEGGAIVFRESLLLAQMGNEIFYIANVAENEYPVTFKLVSYDGGTAVFTNPKHDFPQRITYRQNEDGTMAVSTADITDSATKRIDVLFVKE